MNIHRINGVAELSAPLSSDLAELMSIQELREFVVHGKVILLDANKVEQYIKNSNTAITDDTDLTIVLENSISVEDVTKIYNAQMRRLIVGQQFELTEIGDFKAVESENLNLVVPQISITAEVVENSIYAIEHDDLSKYSIFLPPETEEEKLQQRRCVTGNTLRTFLNDMQDSEASGFNMNTQLLIYAKLLTLMPDDDPTKKYGLMQLRALMLFGDNVSNKNLRLALTQLVEEEVGND